MDRPGDARGRPVTSETASTISGRLVLDDRVASGRIASGVPLPAAVAAASRNPLALLGVGGRGRIAVDQRADLVELDDELRVRRVMRAGTWYAGETP